MFKQIDKLIDLKTDIRRDIQKTGPVQTRKLNKPKLDKGHKSDLDNIDMNMFLKKLGCWINLFYFDLVKILIRDLKTPPYLICSGGGG